MISNIKEKVASHFNILPETLSVSKFFHASDKPDAKVLFLVTDRKKPVCIVKIMRDSLYDSNLKREAEGQRYAREKLNNYLVPEILFSEKIGKHYAIAETVLPGVPVGRELALTYIAAVYSFQKEQPKLAPVSVESIIVKIRSLGIQDEKVTSLINDLEVMGGTLCQSWSHGDLTFMNVMDIEGKLAFIDWDRFNERPFWGIDFVHYLIRAANIKDLSTFKNKLSDHLNLPQEEQEYFIRVYLLDELLDFLHKNFRDRLNSINLG